MRIKALLKHNSITVKYSSLIFYSCYMAGNIIGILISNAFASNSANDLPYSSTSIIGFLFFSVAVYFIASFKESKFYISRSVTRKEIFVSDVITMLLHTALSCVLQIVAIYILGFVFTLFGHKFLGLEADVQKWQAPNMNNVFVFFFVSFGILLLLSALGYLLGSLSAKWKAKTIGTSIVLVLIFAALMTNQDFLMRVLDFLKYMFTDDSNGIWIAVKLVIASAILLAISFPIARRITAEKK